MNKEDKVKLDELIVLDFKIKQAIKNLSNQGKTSWKDIDNILKLAYKFVGSKRDFKKEISSLTFIKLEEEIDRNFLKSILSNKDFIGDKIAKLTYERNKEKYDLDNYDSFDLEEYVDDFYSWFGPEDHVRSLIEIGVLISPIEIPKSVSDFVYEARQCFAFQRYNAVYALCRTILETAMRDIGVRTGRINKSINDHDFYKEYPPRRLIANASFGNLKKRLHDLYTKLSVLIHGFKTIDRTTAKSTLRETLEMVQELYEKNEERIKK